MTFSACSDSRRQPFIGVGRAPAADGEVQHHLGGFGIDAPGAVEHIHEDLGLGVGQILLVDPRDQDAFAAIHDQAHAVAGRCVDEDVAALRQFGVKRG